MKFKLKAWIADKGGLSFSRGTQWANLQYVNGDGYGNVENFMAEHAKNIDSTEPEMVCLIKKPSRGTCVDGYFTEGTWILNTSAVTTMPDLN